MSVKDGWVLDAQGARVCRVEDVLHHLIDLGSVASVAERCEVGEDDVRASINYACSCVRYLRD